MLDVIGLSSKQFETTFQKEYNDLLELMQQALRSEIYLDKLSILSSLAKDSLFRSLSSDKY